MDKVNISISSDPDGRVVTIDGKSMEDVKLAAMLFLEEMSRTDMAKRSIRRKIEKVQRIYWNIKFKITFWLLVRKTRKGLS